MHFGYFIQQLKRLRWRFNSTRFNRDVMSLKRLAAHPDRSMDTLTELQTTLTKSAATLSETSSSLETEMKRSETQIMSQTLR
ncbi:hypothetical protein OH492_27595 [Vibrio chagasii]|nr:hypothetical protein [Vibrio chagasii]